MDKNYKILILFLLINLLISLTFVKADYNVTVGTVNVYEVEGSEWDFTADTSSSSGTGFRFGDTKYTLNNQLTVTVDALTFDFIDFNVSVGSETEQHTSSPLLLLGIVFLLEYPTVFSAGIEHWIQTEADLGLALQYLFFIEPDTAFDAFELLADDDFISTEYADDEYITHNYVGATFDTGGNVADFTWRYDIRETCHTDNTDYSGTYTFTLSYDQTTGELHSYSMDLDYGGVLGYTAVDIDLYQEVVLQGANPENSPGFSWLITLPTLIIMGILSIIIRKKKR